MLTFVRVTLRLIGTVTYKWSDVQTRNLRNRVCHELRNKLLANLFFLFLWIATNRCEIHDETSIASNRFDITWFNSHKANFDWFVLNRYLVVLGFSGTTSSEYGFLYTLIWKFEQYLHYFRSKFMPRLYSVHIQYCCLCITAARYHCTCSVKCADKSHSVYTGSGADNYVF